MASNFDNFVKYVRETQDEDFNPNNIDNLARELNIEYKSVGNKIDLFNTWGTVVQAAQESQYNSYGDEDTDLNVVVQFPEFNNMLIMFRGNRSSYQGVEWYEMKEVFGQTKTTYYYE